MIETYIPLYRKYRPQQFSDLVGQEVLSTALSNAIALNKISHAYLFCGPRGTGKTSSARIFAKSLNCVNGPTSTPCQTCPSCTGITNGNAVDVTEIDAASNNGVTNIREISEKVQFSPLQGKFKIYIIDEIHMLSPGAFNALLKTLEEPPANVVFIFATTEPHKVLSTIISRCQRFDFSRITRMQIEARLKQVAEMEGIAITPEALTLISRHAKGGLRDALSLLDQVSVLGRNQDNSMIQVQDVRSFIGVMEDDLVLQLAQGILQKDPQIILDQLRLFLERGIDPPQVVKELTQHFRNVLIAKTCGKDAPVEQFDIVEGTYPQLCQQAELVTTEELPQMLSRLSTLENQLKHSHQPQLWLEVGMLDLGFRRDIYLVQDLVERVNALEDALRQGKPMPAASTPSHRVPAPTPASRPLASPPTMQAPTAVPAPTPSAPKPAPTPVFPLPSGVTPTSGSSNLGALWQNVLSAIQHLPTRSLAKDHFTLLEVTETTATVGYFKDTFLTIFKNSPEKNEHLQNAIQQVVGHPCKLNFRLSDSTASSTPPLEPARMTVTPVQALQESPPPTPEPSMTGVSPAPLPPLQTSPEALMPSHPIPAPQTILASVGGSTLDAMEPDEMAFEIEQAKKYTAELLQGKLID